MILFISASSYQFQFHTGSIKRVQDGFRWRGNLGSFNSILVRLKAHNGTWNCEAFFLSFNSILVRLKVNNRAMNQDYIGSRFNSILVRLKGMAGRMGSGTQMGFNSILVRLKVKVSMLGPSTTDSVSIPYWFD